MLDVITIVSRDTPQGWVNQCRRSVSEAARIAGYPVRSIEVPGVPGSIVQAMRNGIAASTAPYVAWVDDDDWVLPNAFSCLAKHFPSRPAAIAAREVQILNNGHIICHDRRHHLTAWRRDVLDAPFETCPSAPLTVLFDAARGRTVDEMSWVYMRRIHPSGGMRIRRAACST